MGEAIKVPGRWSVKVWPSCAEASVSFVKERRDSVAPVLGLEARGWEVAPARWRELVAAAETNEDRAVRRARTEVRRYNRHNELWQFVTLTFGADPPQFDSLSEVMDAFWKRFRAATGRERGAYLWVPEWGKVNGRLHIHLAVPWWEELRCVEVCDRCDRYGVLDRFARHRAGVGSGVCSAGLCLGCLWGHGFVGRPLGDSGEAQDNKDGRALSRYLTKYMVKDLGGVGGRQRYRAAQGRKPTPVVFDADSPDEGVSFAMSEICARTGVGAVAPVMFVPSTEEGYGPPVVLLDWLAKSPEREAVPDEGYSVR